MYDLTSEVSTGFFIELLVLELSLSFCYIIVFVEDNYSTPLICLFDNDVRVVFQ